jgi:vancomycin permeability regulator SanA
MADRMAAHRLGRIARWLSAHRRALCLPIFGGLVLALLGTASYGWTRVTAAGQVYAPDRAPVSEVVIVLGGQVAPDRLHPMPFLAGRLRTAAELIRTGRARVILVSGDGHGASGNETGVMSRYLTGELGIDARLIVADPEGLDTYDSCRRARDVYGIGRALLVTQSYHLTRAVAICRTMGIDAVGVTASCYPRRCSVWGLTHNSARDFLACTKAVLDLARDRPAAVRSPPNPAVSRAIEQTRR